MTVKDMPLTIAPDGQVIELVMVDEGEGYAVDACKRCYVDRECSGDKGELFKLLGYRCTQYDNRPKLAIWQKAKQQENNNE